MAESPEISPMYKSNHDLVESLNDGPLEKLYERGWLHDTENREEYRKRGFHPVHIGDRFGIAGRFRVIHKLGRGGLATIIIADDSRETSSELRLVNREDLNFEEAGGECIVVPREHFWHDGPNGRHLCLVLPVLGPRVSDTWDKLKDPAKFSRDILLQASRGLHFLHKNRICHGDFGPSNILFKLIGFDELSEDDLIKQFGEPKKEPLVTLSGKSPAPSGPEYLVESLNLDRLDARFISDQISIIDFGESYDMLKTSESLPPFVPLSSSSTTL